MNTREEMMVFFKERFKTETLDLGEGIVLTARELSQGANHKLAEQNFVRKGDKLEPNPDGRYTARWIAASIEPGVTVEEVEEWPKSLVDQVFEMVSRVNGLAVSEPARDAAGKS
jgi:hypothetical protein